MLILFFWLSFIVLKLFLILTNTSNQTGTLSPHTQPSLLYITLAPHSCSSLLSTTSSLIPCQPSHPYTPHCLHYYIYILTDTPANPMTSPLPHPDDHQPSQSIHSLQITPFIIHVITPLSSHVYVQLDGEKNFTCRLSSTYFFFSSILLPVPTPTKHKSCSTYSYLHLLFLLLFSPPLLLTHAPHISSINPLNTPTHRNPIRCCWAFDGWPPPLPSSLSTFSPSPPSLPLPLHLLNAGQAMCV